MAMAFGLPLSSSAWNHLSSVSRPIGWFVRGFLRAAGLAPYRVYFDPELKAWIAKVIDWAA